MSSNCSSLDGYVIFIINPINIFKLFMFCIYVDLCVCGGGGGGGGLCRVLQSVNPFTTSSMSY